ncbi:MAG TPA: AzlD domain-containing protein [Gaiellaceae bacterium]|nr:AzlD domain-containing protein [Gaiellaceae bacterium]
MNDTWLTVVLVGALTVALKATGPLVLGGREVPARVAGAVELLAPSLLAALVVTQAVGADGGLALDERLVGVGVAAVAVRFRAPLIVVIVLAAVSTALMRLAL